MMRRPVRVLWTRADDTQHDFYRPANVTALRAGLDARGRICAWLQRIAGPALALGSVDVPYAIHNLREVHIEEDPGVPTGAWRSVGASQNAFAIECFIDELAVAAGVAPLMLRRGWLTQSPRHRAVLDLAAEKAGWGRAPVGKHLGRYQGVALYRSFGSWVAQVAEVSVSEGRIRVHRVVCAIDCGTSINPDTTVSQIEGGIVFGLTAALKGEINISRGRVQQRSFEDYPLLRLAEVPDIEVHILESGSPGEEPPGGVGEPGVPPIAPAVANAVFAATGRRLRSLPLNVKTP
jgi:isoquinoline 1-oxidoreductase beta subunit